MLEFLFELIAEIVVNVVVEGLIGNLPELANRRTVEVVVLLGAGAGLGWASTLLLPNPIIPWPLARVLYILIVPVVVAYLIRAFSRWRYARNGKDRFIDSWTDAYLFSLAFSVTRFAATW